MMGGLMGAITESPWDAAVLIVVALVIGYVVHGRAVSAKLGRIEVSVDAINTAVNHRDPGSPTISDDVAELKETVRLLAERLDEHLAPPD